ncbi:MAG: enoyl-CoA hydratase/isomerase family protein, partial [Actinomycetota bacterium]
LAHGLVHRVAPAGQALAEATAVARAFAEGPTRAYAAAKAALRAAGGDLRPGLALELDAFGALFSTEDRREGMAAFAQKRPPRFTGR